MRSQPRKLTLAPTGDLIQPVTGDTFASWVLEGSGPIAVEFMSYGCEYCRALEPVLQQVAEMVKTKGTIFRVNVATEPKLAESYGVRVTPTLVLFLNGKEVGQVEGPSPTVSSLLTALAQPFRALR